MTVHQPTMVHHGLPLWSELLLAAIVGATILFGVLLAVGHTDLLPWTSTESGAVTPAAWMTDDPAPIPPWAR